MINFLDKEPNHWWSDRAREIEEDRDRIEREYRDRLLKREMYVGYRPEPLLVGPGTGIGGYFPTEVRTILDRTNSCYGEAERIMERVNNYISPVFGPVTDFSNFNKAG